MALGGCTCDGHPCSRAGGACINMMQRYLLSCTCTPRMQVDGLRRKCTDNRHYERLLMT